MFVCAPSACTLVLCVRVLFFFFPSLGVGGLLIFTQAASLVNTFFKMAQGQVVKEQSKKRIFHFSATNVELCSADLLKKARAHSCLPGNVGNVLLGQDERRKKEEEMGGGRKRMAKKDGSGRARPLQMQ